MRLKTILLLALQCAFIINAFCQLQVDYKPKVGDKLIYIMQGKRLQRWEITIKALGSDIVYDFQQYGAVRDSGIFKFSKENLEQSSSLVLYMLASANRHCDDCCAMVVSRKKFKEILKGHANITCDAAFEGMNISSFQRGDFDYTYNGTPYVFKSLKVKSTHSHGEELQILDNDDFPLLLMFKGDFTLTLQQIIRHG